MWQTVGWPSFPGWCLTTFCTVVAKIAAPYAFGGESKRQKYSKFSIKNVHKRNEAAEGSGSNPVSRLAAVRFVSGPISVGKHPTAEFDGIFMLFNRHSVCTPVGLYFFGSWRTVKRKYFLAHFVYRIKNILIYTELWIKIKVIDVMNIYTDGFIFIFKL
jgi:hypothetical protein